MSFANFRVVAINKPIHAAINTRIVFFIFRANVKSINPVII